MDVSRTNCLRPCEIYYTNLLVVTLSLPLWWHFPRIFCLSFSLNIYYNVFLFLCTKENLSPPHLFDYVPSFLFLSIHIFSLSTVYLSHWTYLSFILPFFISNPCSYFQNLLVYPLGRIFYSILSSIYFPV